MAHPRMERLASGLLAARWVLLGVAVVLVALAWQPARQLSFDRSIENMFAEDDPLLPPYRLLKRTFGGNEIALAAYVDPAALQQAGLDRIARLTRRLEQAGAPLGGRSGITAVLSLTQTPLGTQIGQGGALAESFLELFEGFTISADRRTVGVACLLDPHASTSQRAETIQRIRGALQEDFSERLVWSLCRNLAAGAVPLRAAAAGYVPQFCAPAVLTGEPVMIAEGFRLVEDDGSRLGRVATVLLLLTIAACFRSLRWVLIPLAVVQATLLWTEAALVLARWQLSMVSSMLWAIVTVVGIATVVHVLVHYREARTAGMGPRDALRGALALLLVPVTWTCLTDAAGFGALLLARVGPVQDFGLMMMVGSLVALASLVLLLPGLALAAGGFDTLPRRAWGERWMDRTLGGTVAFVLRRPGTLAVAMLVLGCAGVAGSLRVQVESDFTRNFRPSSPLVAGYQLVERNLGGAGVWDVLVPAPAVLDEAFLARLAALVERLRQVRLPGQEAPALTKVLSIADALRAAPQPPLVRLAPQQLFQGLRALMPSVANALYAPDPHNPAQHWARIMLRAHERQPSQQKRWLIGEVTRLAQEAFPGSAGTPQVEVTGFYVLLAQLIDSMLADQWKTFAAACAAIALMLLTAFRSPVIALAALVPNVLPIVVVTGLMGWCGLRINMGAAMIAAVSVGLSVDASIHYLAAYRRHRAAGLDMADALHAVQQRVGRAVTFSTLALVVGFGALCTSDFIPTVYFGALVGLAMLGGMAGNLLILPLLLSLYERAGPKRWHGGPPDNSLRTAAAGD